MGQKLPTEGDSGRFYAKYRNDILDFRRWGNGQNIKEEEEGEYGHQKDPIPEKEHDQAQKKRQSHIKTQNTVAPSLIGTKRCFPQIQQLRILHTSFLLK